MNDIGKKVEEILSKHLNWTPRRSGATNDCINEIIDLVNDQALIEEFRRQPFASVAYEDWTDGFLRCHWHLIRKHQGTYLNYLKPLIKSNMTENNSVELKEEILAWMYKGLPRGKTIPDFDALVQSYGNQCRREERERADRIVRMTMDNMELETNAEFIACDDFAIKIIKALNQK